MFTTIAEPNYPPFIIGTGSPQLVGASIARVYAHNLRQPPSLVQLWKAAAQALALPLQSGIMRAGSELARDIDAGKGNGVRHGYHNVAHYAEVLQNTAQLILRNNIGRHDNIVLSPHEAGKLLFTALGHDFFYDPCGKPNCTPSEQEHKTFMALIPYLGHHNVNAHDMLEIGVMIYGTDVGPLSKAGSFIRASHRHFFEGGVAPIATDVQRRVEPVLLDKRLCRSAALLGDADLLSSFGLTISYCGVMTERVARECGKPITPMGTIFVIDNFAEKLFTTKAGRFFQRNMNAIRQNAVCRAALALN